MGLFLGLDLGALLGLDFGFEAEAPPSEQPVRGISVSPIPWPKRKRIVAASFTIQDKQTEHIETKVKTAIRAVAAAVSMRHAENGSVFEKTKITMRTVEMFAINMVILGMQNIMLQEIAERERRSKDMRDVLEIIMMDVA